MKRTALFGLIVMFMVTLHSPVDADSVKTKTASQWKDAITQSDDLFADWKGASLHKLFTENQDTAHPLTVWNVEQGEHNLGYFVITDDGKSLVEYSPVTPVQFGVARQEGTYAYAGPGMHLYQQKGAAAEWVNLTNGERLPPGKLSEHVPDFAREQAVKSESRKFDTNLSADNGVAAMIQHGMGQSVPFNAAALDNNSKGGYLVFTALQKDYYSVLALKGETDVDGQSMLKVSDVFAGGKYPFYVRTDVPVNWVGSR